MDVEGGGVCMCIIPFKNQDRDKPAPGLSAVIFLSIRPSIFLLFLTENLIELLLLFENTETGFIDYL